MRTKTVLTMAAIAAAALVPTAAAEQADPAGKPKGKTVRVGDNFFSPDSLRVRPGTVITWKWPTLPGDVHDVYLTTRPKGVKRFHSALAASEYRYRRTLTKLGTYKMVCTIHAEMRMSVKVTRR